MKIAREFCTLRGKKYHLRRSVLHSGQPSCIIESSGRYRQGGGFLKITLNQIEKGEDEVIVRYHQMNGEIEDIVRIASGSEQKIPCSSGNVKCLVSVREILYAESVERMTFLYTSEGVYQTACTLRDLEIAYAHRGFFRCSKSTIINIYLIAELRSETGGRIDAKLENGEHVIISRKYAKELRRELKGDE